MKNEYKYAKNLATYLWKTHYKTDAPKWEPCDDLMGVLTQIDNMIVGLTRRSTLDTKAERLFRKPLSNIAREIKEQYEEFKKNGPDGPVCKTLPFLPTSQLWMYHYLYPEVLQVYNDLVQEKCSKGYKEDIYIAASGGARIYPCWVLPEEEVLRIMAESGIL